MVDYRSIMRLNSLGQSKRSIAANLHHSRNIVTQVLELAEEKNLQWPLGDEITNEVIETILYPERIAKQTSREVPNFAYIHRELAKPGVNLTLLWEEYRAQCSTEGQQPYMYTQYCDLYRKWAKATKATMRITHKPGDAMEVDWAGQTIPIHDQVTGDISKAYLFIAVLPCSCYVYAEVCADMLTDSWIRCHVNAYEYYGGVTRLLIPDNLKTGIIKNTRYETVFNRSYHELANYYDTAIVPARVLKPKDKSHAEGSVRYAETWIIAAIRNEKFFTLEEAQAKVAEKLEELNDRTFKQKEGSRRIAYNTEERQFMRPLPKEKYEPAVWSTGHVQHDYLISDGKNKYSVPFNLIGEDVDIRVTKHTVEVFFGGNRVASHHREPRIVKDPIVLKDHMPAEHQKYLEYNETDFRSWASSVGESTSKVVNYYLTSGKEPEQGYKFSAALRKMGERYGEARLEKACANTIAITKQPSNRVINTILKNHQEDVSLSPADESVKTKETHGITRGAAYFKKGGASI